MSEDMSPVPAPPGAVPPDSRLAIADLDNINAIDRDAHQRADGIILALLPPDVRDAYERAMRRCSFWKAHW